MESVRRRKLCTNMQYVKTYNKSHKIKKTFHEDIHEGDKNVRCSDDAGLSHPYDDQFNLVHALSDTLTVAERWVTHLYFGFRDIYIDEVENGRFTFLDNKVQFCLMRVCDIITEVYYADKRKEFIEGYPRVAALKDFLNREVPNCGNYIEFSCVLVEKAKHAIARNRNKQDRKKDVNKLKIFHAMNRMYSFR